MVIRLFCIIFFALLTLQVAAQTQKPEKILKSADRAFLKEDFRGALPLYEQAVAQKPNNQVANYRLGYIYSELQQPAKAIPYLLKATQLSTEFNAEYTLNLARAYHLNSNFDEAIAQYQAVLAQTRKKDEEDIAELQKRIAECISGKVLQAEPPGAEVVNLGATVNSPFADHAPILINQDKTLVFASRRNTQPGHKTGSEDIFISNLMNNVWTTPEPFDKATNTQGHEAATFISPDGKTMYIYRDVNGGDIFEVKKTGPNTWGKPQALPEPINSKFFEPSFYITLDGQFAFFSSDRPDGFGGLDLYLSMRQPDGTWSEAMNLGTNINTEFDEDAPFISPDGTTLYFSSRGHNSMGGYDLFRSSSEGAAWSIAQNLGAPVNSPANDIYFAATSNGHQAYFASDRAGGLGDKDIYLATFRSAIATDSLLAEVPLPEPPANEIVVPAQVPDTIRIEVAKISESGPAYVRLSGKVLEEETKMPVAAQLILTEKGKLKPIDRVIADSLTGAYSLQVLRKVTYNILVQKEGYFYENLEINVPEAYAPDTLTKPVTIKKIRTGAAIVLRNIFFQYGKDVLSKSSQAELDRLAAFMKENPNLRVEISGHTDNKGKAALNQALSLKRARAVVNYLAKKGISKTRMVAVGYGSRKPVASNRFEEGRKQNRRTEFKVLKQ